MSEDEDKSPNGGVHHKETRINLQPISLPDGNWKTIDSDVLYDSEKRYLTKCNMDDVYKILEYVNYTMDSYSFVYFYHIYRSSPKGLSDDQVNERREKVSCLRRSFKSSYNII